MSNIVKYGLLLLVLGTVVKLCLSEEDGTTTSRPSNPGRMSRKYYDAEIYTGNDDAFNFGDPATRASVAKKYVVPYKHAGSGVMKKSGNNLNWNVWKGDEDNSGDDDSVDNEGPKGWQPPPQLWNNDAAWTADPMTIMMLKNAMADIKGNNKPTGFLSKLSADPALLLIAASIPISLLLAAVLPTIMNAAMNGNGIPTVTTTATGNKARNSQVDIMPYLGPVMEAIGAFGVRSIGNPDCMQRIFCQVAQDKIAISDSKYFKKAASVARFFSHLNWLENYGIKDLVDSMSSGNCESIPCLHSSKKETEKSKYSQKVLSNSVKK